MSYRGRASAARRHTRAARLARKPKPGPAIYTAGRILKATYGGAPAWIADARKRNWITFDRYLELSEYYTSGRAADCYLDTPAGREARQRELERSGAGRIAKILYDNCPIWAVIPKRSPW
jgi:hypothetical protein